MANMLTIEARNKVIVQFMAEAITYAEAKTRLMGLGVDKDEAETALEIARVGNLVKF